MNMTLKNLLIRTCIINCGQRSCPFLKEPSPEGNLVQILTSLTVELPSREGTGRAVAMRNLCPDALQLHSSKEMGLPGLWEHTHLLPVYFDVFSTMKSQCPSAVGYHHVQNSPALLIMQCEESFLQGRFCFHSGHWDAQVRLGLDEVRW